jgi:electron transfer flavoprotein alpha subunit
MRPAASPRTLLGRVTATVHITPFIGGSTRRRFASTLAILEQKDGKLNHGSLSAVTAAQKLGGPIHGFVAGGNIRAAAEEASKVEGLEKVVAVENEAYEKVCGHICNLNGISLHFPS